MNNKIYAFFVLVFAFCGSLFADSYSDCLQLKSDIDNSCQYLLSNNSMISYIAADIAGSANPDQYSIIANARNIESYANNNSYYTGRIVSLAANISCSSNDTCSVDLSVVSNILVCVSNTLENTSSLLVSLTNLTLEVSSFYSVSSNYYDFSLSSLGVVTNLLSNLNYNVDHFFNDSFSGYPYLLSLLEISTDCLQTLQVQNQAISYSLDGIHDDFIVYLKYLRYLEDISRDISYLATNEYFNVNVNNFTNQLYSSSLLGFDRFRFYAQGQANNNNIQLYPLSPYDSSSHLRNATIYDVLSSGFASLLISQGSINNYLYWLKTMAGSNRLEAVEAHLVAVSNLVGRLDDYVLGDFSNEVASLVESLSYVTNRVDYTTNLVEIASLLQTSTNHLASIDSKLDVLDYIKVLSDTPLSDFSGGSYYDYLTNLYLNGSSSAPSTNWFERIEILLASMVFGDSGASTISNEVEFSNFSEETIENAFNDYTFQNELNSGIDIVENTGENFLTILRGFHDSLSSVTQPQSIAIGIGGLDGQDTTTYQDVMHGHFQVSFNSGASDNFTLIVRSMTTIIWILVTMMFVYFSARWLLSKVLFFYRLMRTLITSLFLK